MDEFRTTFFILLISFLFLFSLPSFSALTLKNVTINSSNNDSLYSNNSNIQELTVTSSGITIKNALGDSVFTAFSNLTTFVRSLTSPFNNIYFDYANTIISTINEDISLTTGQRMEIFAINSSTNINQTVNNYGGSTTVIGNPKETPILNKTKISASVDLTAKKTNIIEIFTYDQFGNPIDIQKIKLKFHGLNVNYVVNHEDIGDYTISFMLPETTKKRVTAQFSIIGEYKEILIYRDFLVSENTNTIEKTIFKFSAMTLVQRWLFYIFTSLILVFAITLLIYTKKKRVRERFIKP